jgi:hypothetical protein
VISKHILAKIKAGYSTKDTTKVQPNADLHRIKYLANYLIVTFSNIKLPRIFKAGVKENCWVDKHYSTLHLLRYCQSNQHANTKQFFSLISSDLLDCYEPSPSTVHSDIKSNYAGTHNGPSSFSVYFPKIMSARSMVLFFGLVKIRS